MAKQYWLIKSEPSVYSIDDLKRDKTTWWEGVRNYQARNFMMNDMKLGDEILFYHSNTEPPGVAGLATVSAQAQPDATALDPKSSYYDPKAAPEKPIWFCVQVQFRAKFKSVVDLAQIRSDKRLKDLLILRPGSRLSVTPVSAKEFQLICELAGTAVSSRAHDGR